MMILRCQLVYFHPYKILIAEMRSRCVLVFYKQLISTNGKAVPFFFISIYIINYHRMVENENSGRRILLDSFQDQPVSVLCTFFFIIIYIVVNKQKSHLLSKKT